MNCSLKINWSIRSPLLLLSTLSKPAPPPYGFTTVADNNNLPLPLDHQIQFNFGELVGRQFCNFSKAFMDKLCCSGIDNPPCHSMAEGRNGLMKLFPDHHDANNDDGDARFSRITLVQCSWSFGFIAAMIDFLRKTSEDNGRFSASLAFLRGKWVGEPD